MPVHAITRLIPSCGFRDDPGVGICQLQAGVLNTTKGSKRRFQLLRIVIPEENEGERKTYDWVWCKRNGPQWIRAFIGQSLAHVKDTCL